MGDRLKIQAPGAWEQWAERRLPFIGDPERPQRLQDATRLVSPSGRTKRLWLPSGHIIHHPVAGGSRLFDDASTHSLDNTASAPVAVAPLTLAGWFNSDSLTLDQQIVQLQDKDVGNDRWWIQLSGNIAGDFVQFYSQDGTASPATTSLAYSTDTWQHACGVEIASNSRVAYLDGGNSGTETTLRTPDNIDSISIGRAGDSTPNNHFSGMLAEIAVWDVALAAGDVVQLADGFSPLFVRPESLVFYCPIIGSFSPEIDLIGGRNMTVTGATKAAHPRVFYPALTQRFEFGAAAPPTTALVDMIGRGVVPFAR